MTLPDENRKYARARITWPLNIKTASGNTDGVTHNIGAGGVHIRCSRPLGLSKVFDMVIKATGSNKTLSASVEKSSGQTFTDLMTRLTLAGWVFVS